MNLYCINHNSIHMHLKSTSTYMCETYLLSLWKVYLLIYYTKSFNEMAAGAILQLSESANLVEPMKVSALNLVSHLICFGIYISKQQVQKIHIHKRVVGRFVRDGTEIGGIRCHISGHMG